MKRSKMIASALALGLAVTGPAMAAGSGGGGGDAGGGGSGGPVTGQPAAPAGPKASNVPSGYASNPPAANPGYGVQPGNAATTGQPPGAENSKPPTTGPAAGGGSK